METVAATFQNETADIYQPTLPYSSQLSSIGAWETVASLAEDLDAIWDAKPRVHYERVVLIGYSLGGLLVRSLFLAGAARPPDYAEENSYRAGLPETFNCKGDWTKKVDRILLLATWDKGWTISDRTSWYNATLLNFFLFLIYIRNLWLDILGLFKANEVEPGKAMLDTRRGAPFVVQSRLLWLAYRRWFSEADIQKYNIVAQSKGLKAQRTIDRPPPADAVNPLVIQVIGALDDFVSPHDQIDLDIEGIRAWSPNNRDAGAAQRDPGAAEKSVQVAKKFFVLEMPGTDHTAVINFDYPAGETRRQIVAAALVLTGKQLQDLYDGTAAHPCAKFLRNPVHLWDTPPAVDTGVTDLVFVIHGIRDDGYWTHRIAAAVKQAWDAKFLGASNSPAPRKLLSWTHSYGYFPMAAFVIPWIRRTKVEWFMDHYASIKTLYPNATLHYVGHSNGTYLAAAALRDYPAARFGNVYFAGSVVDPTFDWIALKKQDRIARFHNARGGTDWVVALLPKSLEYFMDLGGAGFDGFQQIRYKNKDSENVPPELTQSRSYAVAATVAR